MIAVWYLPIHNKCPHEAQLAIHFNEWMSNMMMKTYSRLAEQSSMSLILLLMFHRVEVVGVAVLFCLLL